MPTELESFFVFLLYISTIYYYDLNHQRKKKNLFIYQYCDYYFLSTIFHIQSLSFMRVFLFPEHFSYSVFLQRKIYFLFTLLAFVLLDFILTDPGIIIYNIFFSHHERFSSSKVDVILFYLFSMMYCYFCNYICSQHCDNSFMYLCYNYAFSYIFD